MLCDKSFHVVIRTWGARHSDYAQVAFHPEGVSLFVPVFSFIKRGKRPHCDSPVAFSSIGTISCIMGQIANSIL
jgi:hypothetical protein